MSCGIRWTKICAYQRGISDRPKSARKYRIFAKKSNIVRSLFRMCVLTLAARQKTLFTLAAKWRSESGQG